MKSIDINSYDHKTWFTLGCAYLRVKDYQNAVQAFSNVV